MLCFLYSDEMKEASSGDENKIALILRTELIDSDIVARRWNLRKVSRVVSSKYMATRGGGGSSDDSWLMKTHKAVKKANNSVIGYVSSKSHWPLPHAHISFRPQPKSVEKIVSLGFDLFKHKKSSTSDFDHQLRLLDNRFIQWRFANARVQAVNHRISFLAESNLICVLDGLAKLRYSVVLSKIEFEREKLEMKIDCILLSQMKLLETWGRMERRYVAAITIIQECLYSVACRIHLLEGAVVDIELTSITQNHALNLTDSTESLISTFSPLANETAGLLSELAEVVLQERFLLEEFSDIFQNICVLELEERSLMCSLIQLQC
ncbi:hypothetical protein VNO78_06050 [Psophocarpus tetragonolobus]|uniref:Uncharacterized protein n=1 Tax=Psophocarpus tetragonolobus TaxID=3891 RepID=A0AAN9XRW8_PSOTE